MEGTMAIEILLIDDDPDFSMMLRTLLRGRDFQVRAVFSGDEGIDACRDDPPDVVILDLLMPEMNGWEVCERIRTFRKRAINEWGYKRNELGANLWVILTTIMQLKLMNYDFSPKLKSIKQPYLFLAGRYDPQMNFEELNRYKASMTDASLKVIENSGHLFDNPHDMISEIKTFIYNKNASQQPRKKEYTSN